MEIFEQFLLFEKEESLFQKEIFGFYYWNYIRMEIYSFLNTREVSSEVKNKNVKKTMGNKSIVLGNIVSKFLFHNPMWKKSYKGIIFFQDPVVYNPVEKYYECNITPCIVDYFRENALLISNFNLYQEKKRLRFPETTFMVTPVFKVALTRRLYIFKVKTKKLIEKFQREAEYLYKILKQYFNLTFSEQEMFHKLYYNYLMWNVYTKYYEKILRKKKPKIIIEQCYYSFYKMALNEVAKKQKVPVVELQHGVMGMGHPAYNILERNIVSFPDYIFLFSELWKNYTRLPLDEKYIRITGSCNLEEMTQKYQRNSLNLKKVVLFIGQDKKKLFEYTLEACKIIRERNLNYLIYYKLHPNFGEFASEFKEKSRKYTDILQIYMAQEKNLYECFAEADIQIAESSTGLYEGIAFGLKTYIIPSDDIDNVQPLIDLGYAKVINQIDEIFEREKEEDSFDIGLIWKENAKRNIINEIKKVMK